MDSSLDSSLVMITLYRAEIERLKLALEQSVIKTEPEIVICSAIRLEDGRIFRGHRHGDCIQTAHDLVTYQKRKDIPH